MERLTQNNFDYCLEMCEPETQLDCAFYMSQTECVCGEAAIYNKLREYEDTGLEPEEVKEITSWSYGPFHKKMGDWLKAEQEGRLVVLPCKVGDTVWGVVYDTRDCLHCVGLSGCFGCSKANPIDVYRTDFKLHMVEKIGKTVFLTRAEAEKAMEVSEDD